MCQPVIPIRTCIVPESMRIFLLLMLLASCSCQTKSVNRNYCPVRHCTALENEMERWDCIGRQLYKPLEPGVDPLDGFYMQHDCHYVGWGNSVRGFFVSAFMAMLTGRRLSIYHSQFNRMFSSPYAASHEQEQEWDWGYQRRVAEQEAQAGRTLSPENLRNEVEYVLASHWDYSPVAHAEKLEKWQQWTQHMTDEQLQDESRFKRLFTVPLLLTSMCGGSKTFIQNMDCLKEVLPQYHACITGASQQGGPDPRRGIPHVSHAAPAFHFSFRRPSPLMVENLALVRSRVGLPPLAAGLEPLPGQWGLRTPGVYLLALHFRSIPVGFEPLGVDMQQGVQGRARKVMLHAFWVHAVKSAEHAKQIASCRGEELMIYLATDDPFNLRHVAQEKLGHIGRVVFGLDVDDVGHMVPGWTEKHHKNVQEALRTRSLQGLHADPNLARDNQEVDVPKRRRLSHKEFNVHLGDRSESAKVRHGDWSMTEWFVLSSAHWLIGHSGSAFAETAGTLGLSPLGAMERFDMIHQLNFQTTSYRNDWDSDDMCRVVHAADPKWREACPNVKINYTWKNDSDEL